MNPRSTGLLAIVAALLGAFIYFYEIGGEVDRRAKEEADKRIFAGLDVDSIETISLDSQDGVRARFVRHDGGWLLTDPVRAPADTSALDAIAAVLSQISREGQVDAPGPLAEYGLAEDARKISFEVGGESRGLLIGRATPVGGHLYVTTLGDSAVSYVESFRVNAFNRNLADLRDRRVLPFEAADATRLSISWPGGRVELEKSDQTWRMISPVEEPADAPTVRNLLENLSFLRAEGFVDEETDRIREALASVALDVMVTVDGKDRQVTIGAAVPEEGDSRAVRIVRGRDGRLFRIAPERLEEFERSVSAYRFRTLSEFDGSSARKVAIGFTSPGAAETQLVEARLEGAAWSSLDVAIDPARFDSLVQSLAQLRAMSVVADEMGPSELESLGLAPPRVQLRVEGASDSGTPLLADVRIGRLDPERGLYAQRVDDSKIYLLDASAAETIPVSWSAFEEGFLERPDAEGMDRLPGAEPADGGEDSLFDLELPEID